MEQTMKRYIELTLYFTENMGKFLSDNEMEFLKWLVLNEEKGK